MVFIVYVKVYSSDQIYEYLAATVSYTDEECQQIYSTGNSIETTFYKDSKYACGPVTGNRDGSYLTMLSSQGLMFGIINIVGNFGTVFVDQSYWQSAIAARPESAAKGYLLGGYVVYRMASAAQVATTWFSRFLFQIISQFSSCFPPLIFIQK